MTKEQGLTMHQNILLATEPLRTC